MTEREILMSCRAGAAVALAVVVALTAAAALPAGAEERQLEIGKWYPTAEAGINLTQSAYSDNWRGGDKGSVVWAAIFNGGLENQFTSSLHWNNTLKLAFGQTHQQKVTGDGERVWERPEKSNDLIDYETILRITRGWQVDPYVSGRFESQFIDASDEAGRELTINPMQFKESAGLARKFINEEDTELLSRVGVTLRQNVRRLYSEPAPATDTETEVTSGIGAEWVTDYKAKILDDKVAWTSKLTVFMPAYYSEKETFENIDPDTLDFFGIDREVADFTESIDLDWENIFTTQITKYLSVNLYVQFVYDKYDNSVPPLLRDDGSFKNPKDVKAAIRKAGQFKQTMAIGLTYRFL
jgi:hypothetical protein